MHIPDGFLDPKTAVTTGVLAAAGLGVALRQARLHLPARRVPLLGLSAAFVFAAQMLNFPVAGGTSGHLIGGVLTAALIALALGACGTPRLAGRPQPDADLSGRWVLESGDDAAKMIAAALPKPRKPREVDASEPNLMRMPRDGSGGGRRGGGDRSGGRGGSDSSQSQQGPAADPSPAWGHVTPREFVSAFVLPPLRLDVAQQPTLVRVGAGDRPRAFEPGDEDAVTVNDRYGSRAVRAGWTADTFVIASEDRNRLRVVEQLRRNREGRLERTVDFSAPQIKSLRVHSVYRLAMPADVDTSQSDGPPAPAALPVR